jgi:hypothetical protein
MHLIMAKSSSSERVEAVGLEPTVAIGLLGLRREPAAPVKTRARPCIGAGFSRGSRLVVVAGEAKPFPQRCGRDYDFLTDAKAFDLT